MTITPSNTRIARAQMFFRAAHDSINHKRKYTGKPYWTHTETVAGIVSNIGGTEDMVIAALGHDYFEDVCPRMSVAQRENIIQNFGVHSYRLMIDLTDVFTSQAFPNWNRNMRKKAEAARLGRISEDAKVIKLADMIDNTSDILQNDPKFATVYMKEKEYLLPFLTVPTDPRNVALVERLQLTLG